MGDTPPPPSLVRPVAGTVVSRFTFVRAQPFQADRRRVLRLRGAPGAAVRAPCRGRVRFAGRTPRGTAVAVRCGSWSATLSGLGAVERRAGAAVGAGRVVGRVGRSGVVALGLRRARDPFGYVDPLPLLTDPAPPPASGPLGAAPRARRPVPRSAPVPVGPTRVPAPALLRAPAQDPAPALLRAPAQDPTASPKGLPPVAWGGLALAALGLPAGLLRRRRLLRHAGASGRAAAGIDAR
jgi:hypothetical protein